MKLGSIFLIFATSALGLLLCPAGLTAVPLTNTVTISATSSPSPTLTASPTPWPGSGTGLCATYFTDPNGSPTQFTAPPVVREVDSEVNFTLGTSPNWPPASVGSSGSDFSVSWTGQVLAPYTGLYTFSINSDDGSHLFLTAPGVTTEPFISDGGFHGPTQLSNTVTLTAGTLYTITMDYFQGGGGATAQLSWSGPNIAQEIIPSQYLYSGGCPAFTATVTPTDCPTITVSPTDTATPTSSPTLTPVASGCGLVVATGQTLTLSAGDYYYCDVHVYPGGTLLIDSTSGVAVTITAYHSFTVDAGGLIRGTGLGYAGGQTYAVGGGPGGGTGSGYGGGGGGHGGHGGNGYAPGGGIYDMAGQPGLGGSGGGGGSLGVGGAGGAAFVIEAGNGTVLINGTIQMNGAPGQTYGGGGGAGGTINIQCGNLEGSGSLSADGGSGGGDFSVGSYYGGGGGGGGMINLCYGSLYTFSGSVSASGGNGGSGAIGGSPGGGGTIDSCLAQGLPLVMTSTFPPSPTGTPTPAPPFPSATPTAGPEFAYAGSSVGRTVLAPVPALKGQPVCLYFVAQPASTQWQVYNVAGQLVSSLSFAGVYSQCLDTGKFAPGVYLAQIHVVYSSGAEVDKVQKFVIVR